MSTYRKTYRRFATRFTTNKQWFLMVKVALFAVFSTLKKLHFYSLQFAGDLPLDLPVKQAIFVE